jgi:hypothetical protein
MLHFLLGVALCIFIGERLVRYWAAYRLRRDVNRSLAWPPPDEPQPAPAPRQVPTHLPTWASCAVFACWGIAIAVVIIGALRL